MVREGVVAAKKSAKLEVLSAKYQVLSYKLFTFYLALST